MVDVKNLTQDQKIRLAFEAKILMPEISVKGGVPQFNPVDGIPVTYVAFWNGVNWQLHSAAIRDKSLYPGGVGPLLKENILTLFACNLKRTPVFKNFEKIGDIIKQKLPDYRGPVAMEYMLGERPYLVGLDFTITHDIAIAMNALHSMSLSEIVESIENGRKIPLLKKGFVASMRLYSFNYQNNLTLPIPEELADEVASGEDSHLLVAHGTTIRDAWSKVYEKAEKFRHGQVCYRNDGKDFSRAVFKELKKRDAA
jgi:hypothetical protein